MGHDLDEPTCVPEYVDGPCAYYQVSIIDLIAHPKQFHGKVVQLVGYAQLEFEGNEICLSRDDSVFGVTDNCLWLGLETFDGSHLAGFKEGYAIVQGTFNGEHGGHMGLYRGAIGDLERFDPWSLH